MATYLTLSNDETFKIDNPSGKLIKHQHCDEKYSIVGTDDKDNYVYTLKYNGELYKDNIKINENINNICSVYKNTFICYDNRKNLMYYNGKSFKQLIFKNKISHEIFRNYIILVYICDRTFSIKSHAIYFIHYEKLLSTIGYNDTLLDNNANINAHTAKYLSFFSYDSCAFYENYPEINILKIYAPSLAYNVYKYVYYRTNSKIICFFHKNHQYSGNVCLNIDETDIIDILFIKNQWMIIKKNSTIEWYDDNNILLEKSIIDNQIIRYNEKNIFTNKITLDLQKDIKYFTEYTKKQIIALLIVLQKYNIIMPKSIKFMIIQKILCVNFEK